MNGAIPKLPLRERMMLRENKRRAFVWIILTPILVWFTVFMFLPILSVVFYSFTDAKMQYGDFSGVGLANYVKMFKSDPLVPTALGNTLQAVMYILPGILVLSLLLAAGLNSVIDRAREGFTFIYFLPSVVPMSAIALVWAWLYHPQYGLLNAALRLLELPPQQFIMSSAQAMFCICVIEIWQLFGYYAVILLAAMRGVSPDIYEAADIDGAGSATKFFKITVPLIKSNIIFVSIMSTINAFMLFTPVDVLTLGRGTPGTSTMVLMLHIKIQGIQQGNTGYSATLSILLLAIILAVSLVQWLLSQEGSRGATRR